MLIAIGITLSCCNNDDDDNNSGDTLPPATQTGENTIGCLVNGEVLLPSGGGIGGNTNVFYQFIDGKFFLGLGFSNDDREFNRGINIASHRINLESNQTYTINKNFFSDDEFTGVSGEYFLDAGIIDNFYTTSSITGELYVSRIDLSNSIISGTFWFDAINVEGDIVEIREGRFDYQY